MNIQAKTTDLILHRLFSNYNPSEKKRVGGLNGDPLNTAICDVKTNFLKHKEEQHKSLEYFKYYTSL